MSPQRGMPEELAELMDELSPRHQQALQAGWKRITEFALDNARLLEHAKHLIHRMIQVVSVALALIAVAVGVFGGLSVKLLIDQGHQRQEALRTSCLHDNQRYHRAVKFIALLAKVQSGRGADKSIAQLARDEGLHPSPALIAKIKKIESGTPSAMRDAQLEQGQLQFNALINRLAPLHANCAAYARSRTT